MYRYGKKSMSHYVRLHPKLRIGLDILLKYMDHSLVSSLRGEEEQNALYKKGASHLKFPQSKHNGSRDPLLNSEEKMKYSDAVDIIPHPGGYKDVSSLLVMMGRLIQIYESLGIKVIWGGDWDRDGVLNDEPDEFFDGFHIELVHEK